MNFLLECLDVTVILNFPLLAKSNFILQVFNISP